MPTPEWPSTLPTPEQDGYRVSRGKETVSIRLDGGPARVRRDSLGTPHEVSVTFLCDETEYTGVIGFLRQRIESRTKFFRLPMLIDVPVAIPYLVRPLDEPEVLESTRGLSFVVRATLEVVPNPIKSFNLLLQSVSDDRVIDAGSSDYAGDMSEFPVGRQVLLTGCQGVASGVPLNLDGTYTILGAPGLGIRTLQNASAVNADWTALNGTAAQIMGSAKNGAACILLPE